MHVDDEPISARKSVRPPSSGSRWDLRGGYRLPRLGARKRHEQEHRRDREFVTWVFVVCPRLRDAGRGVRERASSTDGLRSRPGRRERRPAGVSGQAGAQTEFVVQGPPPAPPPPQPETMPPSPGVEYFWIGGYHRWNGHAYAWVGGHYEHRPHPDAQWHAAHWEPRGSGHVWIEGNWGGQATASSVAAHPSR